MMLNIVSAAKLIQLGGKTKFFMQLLQFYTPICSYIDVIGVFLFIVILNFSKHAKYMIYSRLRREPSVTVREARESKSFKSVQIKQIYFERFEKICEISVTKWHSLSDILHMRNLK